MYDWGFRGGAGCACGEVLPTDDIAGPVPHAHTHILKPTFCVFHFIFIFWVGFFLGGVMIFGPIDARETGAVLHLSVMVPNYPFIGQPHHKCGNTIKTWHQNVS